MAKNVLVVGTGTIGLPLIGLLTRHKDKFGIDNVLFNKNTPLKHDSAQIKQMIRLGAKLVTDSDKFDDFSKLGIDPVCTKEQAINKATVVIDCTPKGVGLENKLKYYDKYKNKVKRFIFQGSEDGAGIKFAAHLTDLSHNDKFVQVVSCNTHNIASLLMSFRDRSCAQLSGIYSGDFVCMRRANDISQNNGFVPAPVAEECKDAVFGSHHAKDASDLLIGILPKTKLYSTAIKLNTQYMHVVRFVIHTVQKHSLKETTDKFKKMDLIATTEKNSANEIFSFGRDIGFFGRILNQSIIHMPSLNVQDHFSGGSLISGISFTSQDGNSLFSSVYATIQAMYPDSIDSKMGAIKQYIFSEI